MSAQATTTAHLVELPQFVSADRGALGVAQYDDQLPFLVQRIFHTYGVPSGARRGDHAHKVLQEFLICLAGGIEVSLEDRAGERRLRLTHPAQGLFLPPDCWRTIQVTAPHTVWVTLVSEPHDESDYIHDREAFRPALGTATP